MGIHNDKKLDPYRRKENWQNGNCNFWNNNPMYSQESKNMMDTEIEDLEVSGTGTIKFINYTNNDS